MKRIVREYGMTVILVITVGLLLVFWWQAIGADGVFAQILDRQNIAAKVREENEDYCKFSECKEPEITYRNQRLYAGETVSAKDIFIAQDADGTAIGVTILSVNGTAVEKEDYCFLRSGIYELKVEAVDSYGKYCRMRFCIPVSRKNKEAV